MDDKVAGGQQVIQSQTAQIGIDRGVQRRVAPMRRFRSAMGAARRGIGQRRMVEQGAQGVGAAIAIIGIKVRIAQQDEGRRRVRDGQTAIQQMQPEARLIRVAAAITILGPVKGRRGGMPDQQGKTRATRQQDRQDQVAVRRQALNLGQAGVHVRGKIGLWQVAPEKAAEILCLFGQKRQARQDGGTARAGETAPALGIFWLIEAVVTIDIKAGRLARVGARGVKVRIGVTRRL